MPLPAKPTSQGKGRVAQKADDDGQTEEAEQVVQAGDDQCVASWER